MSFLSGVVSVLNSDGTRADLPNSSGAYQPIVLKLPGGGNATSTDLGNGQTQVAMPTPDITTQVLALVPQWRTVISTDFTAMSTQEFTANGNYTIGGNTWIVEFYGNKYVSGDPFGILNGTGLRLPSYTNLGTNGPYSAMRFSPSVRCHCFGALTNNTTPVRAAIKIGAPSIGGTARATFLGISHPSSGNRRYVAGHPINGASTFVLGSAGKLINDVASALFDTQAVATANVAGLWMPNGAVSTEIWRPLFGTYSTNWANLNTLRVVADGVGGSFPAATTSSVMTNWTVELTSGIPYESGKYSVVEAIKVEAFY